MVSQETLQPRNRSMNILQIIMSKRASSIHSFLFVWHIKKCFFCFFYCWLCWYGFTQFCNALQIFICKLSICNRHTTIQCFFVRFFACLQNIRDVSIIVLRTSYVFLIRWHRLKAHVIYLSTGFCRKNDCAADLFAVSVWSTAKFGWIVWIWILESFAVCLWR